MVNSRPLTYIDDDVSQVQALTPAHFLSLKVDSGLPSTTEEINPQISFRSSPSAWLLQRWKKGQKLLDAFWKVWLDQYLLALRERKPDTAKEARVVADRIPAVGDVVIIKEPGLRRGSWKLGLVEKTNESSDGQIRSAIVRIASGRSITRPLKILHPLECNDQVTTRAASDKSETTSDESVGPASRD